VSRKIFRRYEACLDAGGWHFEAVLMAMADICFCTSHKDIKVESGTLAMGGGEWLPFE